jgi:hypothetical protein
MRVLAYLPAVLLLSIHGESFAGANENAKIAGHLQPVQTGKSVPPICDQAELQRPIGDCIAPCARCGSVCEGF